LNLLDLRKQYAHLYKPSAKVPSVVDVPPLRFLMLDGADEIGGPEFALAMQAILSLAHPVKFAARKELGLAYQVPPAEGLYWDADQGPQALPRSPEHIAWRLMVMLPDPVPGELVEATRAKVAAKKDLPGLSDIRVQTFSEGRSVQIMHVGPYSDEAPSVERLFAFAAQKGYEVAGPRHEVYVSDPGRTAPDRLKTVLRYAIRRSR